MSRQVYKTSAAMQDIVDCAAYLGEQRVGLEIEFLDSIEKTLDYLASGSGSGGLYESQNPLLEGIRVWKVHDFENHLIFYRPTSDGIDLIRVLHGARDIAAIFEHE